MPASLAEPDTSSPVDTALSPAVASPEYQLGKNKVVTLSPTSNRVTAAPTAMTVPAPSDKGVNGKSTAVVNCPAIIWLSRGFKEAAFNLTTTS